MTEHDILFFPDRRTDGAFPVTDAHGNPIARVSAAWSGGRFTVTGIDGSPLCAGRDVALVAVRQVAGERRRRRAAAHGDGQAAA